MGRGKERGRKRAGEKDRERR
uniref:Uncharacterized protein n=1 Tax=Anguilla anguilla TaxID=7936 RepID=A0A0E9UAJ7_ANGAN